MDGVGASLPQAAVQRATRSSIHEPGDKQTLTIRRIVRRPPCLSLPHSFRIACPERESGSGVQYIYIPGITFRLQHAPEHGCASRIQ
jgi:hypothetical protein